MKKLLIITIAYLMVLISCKSGNKATCDVTPEIKVNIIGTWGATTAWDNKTYSVTFNQDGTLVGNNSVSSGIFGPKGNHWTWDMNYKNFLQIYSLSKESNCQIISNQCNKIELDAFDGKITLTR